MENLNVKIGEVYETNNYDIFKRIPGNRKVNPTRVKEIAADMTENGWKYGPILVNRNLEILDGQHRVQSAKSTQTPVRYLVINGGIDDVQGANNSMVWKMIDYILSYIERGNQNYVRLYEVMKKYSATYQLVLRAANISTNNITKESMQNGTLIFTPEHVAKADRKLPMVYEIWGAMSAIGFRGSKTVKETASLFVVEHYNDAVVNKLCAAIKRATPTFLSTMNTQSLLDSFERVYNKGKDRKEKVFFGSDYKLDYRSQGVENRFSRYNSYNSPESNARIALGA